MHFCIETIEYDCQAYVVYGGGGRGGGRKATDLPIVVACSLVNDFATTLVRR